LCTGSLAGAPVLFSTAIKLIFTCDVKWYSQFAMNFDGQEAYPQTAQIDWIQGIAS
jgi:hypothetical protein